MSHHRVRQTRFRRSIFKGAHLLPAALLMAPRPRLSWLRKTGNIVGMRVLAHPSTKFEIDRESTSKFAFRSTGFFALHALLAQSVFHFAKRVSLTSTKATRMDEGDRTCPSARLSGSTSGCYFNHSYGIHRHAFRQSTGPRSIPLLMFFTICLESVCIRCRSKQRSR